MPIEDQKASEQAAPPAAGHGGPDVRFPPIASRDCGLRPGLLTKHPLLANKGGTVGCCTVRRRRSPWRRETRACQGDRRPYPDRGV